MILEFTTWAVFQANQALGEPCETYIRNLNHGGRIGNRLRLDVELSGNSSHFMMDKFARELFQGWGYERQNTEILCLKLLNRPPRQESDGFPLDELKSQFR